MNADMARDFNQLLEGVYSFYRAELSKFHRDVWWYAMKAYSFAAVRDAFNRHVMNPDNGQFLPKPADVVKLIDGGTQDQALIAWSKFELAVQFLGSFKTVVFDDAIIHAVIADMGGWMHLCETSTDKEWPFLRNEFVNRYRSYATRPLVSYPSKLIGRAEAHNREKWPEHVPAPMFVGDEARARKVLEHGAENKELPHRRIGELLPNFSNKPSQLLESK